MKSEAFGLGVIGCGQIATHHLDAIASQLTGKIFLRALCDPSLDRRNVVANLPASQKLLGQQQEPKEYDSLQQLVADVDFFATSVDILFIAVPHDLHESLALQALATKKIVVLEKPLAPTLKACKNLVTASEKLLAQSSATTATRGSTPMLIVAEQSPYWQEVALARTMIANGAIGRVVTAAAYYYESMRDNITSGSVDSATGNLGWRGSLARAGGGIAIDGGLHWIRPLSEMLGRIDEVVAVTRCGLAPELGMEGESLAHAILKIQPPPTMCASHSPLAQPDGAGCLTATYSCNMLATAPMAHDACPYFRVTGTKGELVIRGDGLSKKKPGAGGLILYDEKNPTGTDLLPKDRVGGFFLGFAGLWREIHRICAEQDYAKAHDTVVRAADDVSTVLAMYKSAQSGKWESTQR